MAARLPKKARYITFPNQCLASENFGSLSPHAVKLLMDLAAKYQGFNNGDLNMVWPEMKARGWNSKTTLYKYRDELIEKGWLIQTRQGWNNRCALYGITFMKLGDFGGNKLDVPDRTIASNEWKKWTP